MRRTLGFQGLLLCLMAGPGTVFAAPPPDDDDDDFEFDAPVEEPVDRSDAPPATPTKEKEKEKQPASPPPAAPPPVDDDDDALDQIFFGEDEEEPGDDLLKDDEERSDDLLAPGTDSARIYREAQESMEKMSADEEVMAWEAYLQKYPNSIFREAVETRIDELDKSQYAGGIKRPGAPDAADADQQELNFSQPFRLSNVNPRTRAMASFDVGVPLFAQATLDFEYAFKRNISLHGGVAGRYQGWGLEVGPRFAFVKSTRLGLVGTFSADMRLNFGPIGFAVRPQLGFGKIAGPAQIMLTFGADVTAARRANVDLFGGLHVGVRFAPSVGMYVESDFIVSQLTRPAGASAFQSISVGFKFYPMNKKKAPVADPLEIGAGANLAAFSRYTGYYVGGFQAMGVYYLP